MMFIFPSFSGLMEFLNNYKLVAEDLLPGSGRAQGLARIVSRALGDPWS